LLFNGGWKINMMTMTAWEQEEEEEEAEAAHHNGDSLGA